MCVQVLRASSLSRSAFSQTQSEENSRLDHALTAGNLFYFDNKKSGKFKTALDVSSNYGQTWSERA